MSLNACSTIEWAAPTDECVWTEKITPGQVLVIGSDGYEEWRWGILRLFDHAANNPFDPAAIAQDRAEIELALGAQVIGQDLARQIGSHNVTRGKICDGDEATQR